MAGENYRRVVPSFWTDPDIKDLSLEDKALLLYFFTSPHSTMIGLYYCPLVYAANEVGLPVEAVAAAVAGSLRPFVQYDPATGEIFVRRSAFHQVGELRGGDNRKAYVRRLLESTHSVVLKRAFLAEYANWDLSVALPPTPNTPKKARKPLPVVREAPSKPLTKALPEVQEAPSKPLFDVEKANSSNNSNSSNSKSFVAAATTNGAVAVPPPDPKLAPRSRLARDPPVEPHWVREAVEIYAEHVGVVAHGKLGKLLKPLVDRRGWPAVKPVWAYFCEFAPVQDYLSRVQAGTIREGEEPVKKFDYRTSPQGFVEHFTHWSGEADT